MNMFRFSACRGSSLVWQLVHLFHHMCSDKYCPAITSGAKVSTTGSKSIAHAFCLKIYIFFILHFENQNSRTHRKRVYFKNNISLIEGIQYWLISVLQFLLVYNPSWFHTFALLIFNANISRYIFETKLNNKIIKCIKVIG